MIPEEIYVVEVTGGIHFRCKGKMKHAEFDQLSQRFYVGFESETDALKLVEKGDEVLAYVNSRPHFIKQP